MLVFRTQLAVTHIHDLAFEWSVYRVRLIFYCSKRHMALMAEGLTYEEIAKLKAVLYSVFSKH